MNLSDSTAEWMLVANLLFWIDARDEAFTEISADMFNGDNQREAFECMKILHLNSTPDFDWQAVMYQAERRGYAAHDTLSIELERYARHIAESPGEAGAWRQHFERIHQLYLRREANELSMEIAKHAHTPTSDIGAEITNHVAKLESLVSESQRKGPRHIAEIGVEVRKRAEAGGVTGLQSPWESLDRITTGWKPGQLIVVGARPGQGKSSFAAAVALKHRKNGVLLFSMEMDGEEIYPRMVAMYAGVPATRYMRGDLSPQDADHAADAEREINESQFWVEDRATLNINQVRMLSRRYASKYGLALVVVDYIGLVDPTDPTKQRYEQVGEISRGLKQLAREVGVPVIAPHQIGRRAESQEPTLADLRESGNIEQDADQVIFIHKTGVGESGVTPVEVIVAKNRGGPVGRVPMGFRRHCTRFEEVPGGNA